ncbi:carotenoid biosynthesis protein [Heliophilum fasciatum]|uniref:Putative membrane protein n=1 Tax=Heliophilum fasciatum TaxID=35700 RepID=A0A4R2RIM7_9FIRM|nr:carotenoid biosynthesis protein [Heliophilum fasciatum]MCW2278604.1 putative membrane protein [Heliophilum fasciatum]TCP62694.1 putative membrane protein [Heliophilum fasciatum]
MGTHLIAYVFWFWYAIGLILLLFLQVPEMLRFANGAFLFFYALYALYLDRHTPGSRKLFFGRAIAVAVIAFVVEWVGTKTGWPFGAYSYSTVLGEALGGVPLAIGFAWIGVVTNGVTIARARTLGWRALEVGCWALAFDAVLDPVAYARGFWTWYDTGVYYGIPAQNFAGWFVLAALLSLLFPIREVQGKVLEQARRLYQGVLLMFGLLALKSNLFLAFLVAIVVIALVEFRDRRSERWMWGSTIGSAREGGSE